MPASSKSPPAEKPAAAPAPGTGLSLVQRALRKLGLVRDNDFARNGGKGFYATLGMSITERTGKSISDFWRGRLGGGDK